MRTFLMLVVVTTLAPSCGEPDSNLPDGVAGTYVMGDANKARKKATEREVDDPGRHRTFRELAEAEEITTFSASADILLVLNEDETFEYYGPLKMGDDEALIRGRWTKDETAIHLRLNAPRPSKEATVSHLVCPWRSGVIEYPLGRDPAHQVYYRLLDKRRLGKLKGGIRIGGKRAGGD